MDELTTTLMTVAGPDNYSPVGQLLREWKATAEIHADPKLARRLRRSIDAGGGAVTIPGLADGRTQRTSCATTVSEVRWGTVPSTE